MALVGLTTDPGARSLPRQFWRWLRCAPDEDLSVLPVMARDLFDVGAAQAVHRPRLRPHAELDRAFRPCLGPA